MVVWLASPTASYVTGVALAHRRRRDGRVSAAIGSSTTDAGRDLRVRVGVQEGGMILTMPVDQAVATASAAARRAVGASARARSNAQPGAGNSRSLLVRCKREPRVGFSWLEARGVDSILTPKPFPDA